MGQNDREGKRTGRDRSRERREGRAKTWERRTPRGEASLESIGPDTLMQALEALLERDGALRIGRSRDRGAFAFGIYLDGEVRTEYVSSTESADEWLAELTAWLRGIEGGEGGDGTGPGEGENAP